MGNGEYTYSSVKLIRVALLNGFNEIFEDLWPKVTGVKNILGYHQPGKVSLPCPDMVIIEHSLNLF